MILIYLKIGSSLLKFDYQKESQEEGLFLRQISPMAKEGVFGVLSISNRRSILIVSFSFG